MAPPFRSYFACSGEEDLRYTKGWSTLCRTLETQQLADRAAAPLHEPGPQESQPMPRANFCFLLKSYPFGLSGIPVAHILSLDASYSPAQI